ncbi:histone-lysine N-methyltransferase SUVR4-like [Prosopis cineraria]|uniref:histone-lysine N-methyltransferase SUVR4-like n=1 Tax=Prosopis cineraria TaxID=364024 RepID=UPI002410774A|nr:histone-lysine N-methyltransferase SUVR4-like [Prosopis cineraria]
MASHETPNSRVAKAFNAMNDLGISHDEVKPVLQKLLKLHDENWEYIEEDNYQTLVDAYFEHKEDKESKDKRKALISHHDGERQTQPLANKDDVLFLTTNNSRQKFTMEENEMPPSSSEVLTRNHHIKLVSSLYLDLNSVINSAHNNNPTSSKATIDIASSALGEVKIFLNCDHALENNANILTNGPQQAIAQDEKLFHFLSDITKGSEKVKISLIDEYGKGELPNFNYMPHNLIYQSANVNISLARIADEGYCSNCSGNCLSQSLPCACAQETGGEFAYTLQGLLKDEFLTSCMSMKKEPQTHQLVYCQECPLERSKNECMPEQCKGHLIRKFIKECWRKCGCDMQCGNRIVQRGLRCKLQVFFTSDKKGWGLRTLEDLPKGSFICEYVGEILTNMELHERIMHKNGNDKHTYPVTLDADWGSEVVLKDEEALCLDATYNGNVARFINHRCSDANLMDIPVEVETPDRHYYHLAFFTNKKVNVYEELTWDYGIDFDDHDHPIKAFQCCCESPFCRDKKRKGQLNNLSI